MPGELVEYPFNAGLDQGNDARRTPKFIAVENFVWTKRNRLEKRYGYLTLPTPIFPPAGGAVSTVTLTNGGSGYSAPFLFTFTGGGGTGGGGVAVTTAGAVTSLIFVSGGHGYSTTPTVSFAAGSGTGAAATATLVNVGGTSLAQSYTLAASPEGVLQTTDGQYVYAFSESDGFWNNLGPIPNISIATRDVAIEAQTIVGLGLGGGSANGANWLTVECDGLEFWWAPDITFIQAPDGASRSRLGFVNEFGPTCMVTDGARFVWQFYINFLATQVSWQFFDLSIAGSPQPIFGGNFPNPSGGGSGISVPAWFDAVWNPATSQLVTAYVDTVHPDFVTATTWHWNAATYAWTIGTSVIYQLAPVHGFSAAFTMNALSVAVGPSGSAYVAWAFIDTFVTPNHAMVRAAEIGNSETTLYDVPVTTTIESFNVSIVERSINGAYMVAFTAHDVVAATSSLSTNNLRVIDVDDGGVVTNSAVTVNVALGSRLFVEGGRPYAMTYALSSSTYYLHDLTPPASPSVPVAIINPRVGFASLGGSSGTIQSPWALPTPMNQGAGVWHIPVTTAPEPSNSNILNEQMLTLGFGQATSKPASEARALLYPASIPTVAGTKRTLEAQFMAPPVIMKVALAGSSGHLSAGEYSWVATYARLADDGSIIEGPPSNAVTATATANNTATLTITQYSLSASATGGGGTTNIFLIIYRTQAGQGDSFFRVIADPFTDFTGTFVGNNPLYNALTYLDGAADTDTASNPHLYTDGGVFSNVCPPACTIAARVRDRVYLAGTPNGFTAYYSDPVSNVGTANFHDEQVIITDDNGPITAISPIDSNVAIFKETAIYVVYGTEGSNTGNGNTLSIPVELASGGIGCLSQSSLVYATNGVMFQSHRGIELLDRSLSVTFIGEPVKDQLVGRTVVAAVLVPEQYQIRFYMDDWSAVVLCTLNGEWTHFSYSGKPTSTISDATILGSSVYWCGNGHVMQETVGSYADNTSNIFAYWQSGWITLGQLEGYRRYRSLQLLGQWFAETSLQVVIQTDYKSSPIQTSTWTSDEIAVIPEFDSSRIQLEITPALQKAEAVSVFLLDEGPSDGTHTKGIGWEALSFEIALKAGRYRKLSDKASR